MNDKEVKRIAKRIVKKSKTMTPEALELAIIDAIYEGIADSYMVAAKLSEMNYSTTKHEQFAVMARTMWRVSQDPRRNFLDDDPPLDETEGRAS